VRGEGELYSRKAARILPNQEMDSLCKTALIPLRVEVRPDGSGRNGRIPFPIIATRLRAQGTGGTSYQKGKSEVSKQAV
jgi:hypothetical protein